MATGRRQPRIQQPTTPLTSMEQFLDAMIRHQIGLSRVAGGYRKQVFELLDATEVEIRATLRRELGRAGLGSAAEIRRLRAILEEIDEIRSTAWTQVDSFLIEQLRELAIAEPLFISNALKTVLPVSLVTKIPDAGRLRAIVSTFPFQGAVMKQQLRTAQAADLRRIDGQIKIGLVQGESIPQISRRIVGTVALGGTTGVTAITRRQTETLVRTATNAIAAEATRRFSLANEDIVSVDLFVATLDAGTTAICRSLDGETFPIRQEFPRLPLHWGERSRRIPMIDPEPIGKRPMKPVHERGLLREFSAAEGIDPVPRRRKDLPFGTKGAFDTFALRRTRELIGRVPAKVNYQTFLERQSAAFQDDVLGKTRGRLFRRGGLTLDRQVDRQTGHLFRLDELARSDAAAFRAAGLDPAAFL